MSGKSFAAAMAVMGVIALLVFGVIAKGENELEIGEAAPADTLPVLTKAGTDEAGSIADYRGQWVLVNIWASWCTPCKAEAPDLVALQDEYGSPGFTILGIQTQDGTDDGLEFVDEHGLNYPSLRDGSGDYADDLGSTGVPETILLDPEGNAAYIRRGQVDSEVLDSEVVPLIESGSAGASAK